MTRGLLARGYRDAAGVNPVFGGPGILVGIIMAEGTANLPYAIPACWATQA
jgi:hypothetical protein